MLRARQCPAHSRLKHLRRTADDRLIAVSANPAYPPIILDDDDSQTVRFLGVVTELHREYRAS